MWRWRLKSWIRGGPGVVARLTSLSPGKLPKVGGGTCDMFGARWPPLCWGTWGMGEGECAGDGILWLPLPVIGMGTAPAIWGVPWGDGKPNWMFLWLPTGPPFAMWLAGALMVTELVWPWLEPPLTMELPRATGGAAEGTAGVTVTVVVPPPFSGCCWEAFWEVLVDPTTTGVWEPVAISGDVGFVFAPAAEAYDAAGALVVVAGFWLVVLAVEVIREYSDSKADVYFFVGLIDVVMVGWCVDRRLLLWGAGGLGSHAAANLRSDVRAQRQTT